MLGHQKGKEALRTYNDSWRYIHTYLLKTGELGNILDHGEIFCQFITDDNNADMNNCQVRNLDLDVPTENSTCELGNFDEDSISRTMNPVEEDADLDEFEHFMETNSIFSEAVDYEEFEDLVQDFVDL